MKINSAWRSSALVTAGFALAAVLISGPALAAPASSSVHILSKTRVGPVTLANSDHVMVGMSVPGGKWLVSAKLWADSQPGKPTTNTVVGCSLWRGAQLLDASAFNTPKLGGAGGTSAGAEILSAAVSQPSTRSFVVRCDDFGSMAVAHEIVLTAIGG